MWSCFDCSFLCHVEAKSKKFHISTTNVSDLSFVFVQLQKEFLFNERLDVASVLSADFLLLQKIIISSA